MNVATPSPGELITGPIRDRLNHLTARLKLSATDGSPCDVKAVLVSSHNSRGRSAVQPRANIHFNALRHRFAYP